MDYLLIKSVINCIRTGHFSQISWLNDEIAKYGDLDNDYYTRKLLLSSKASILTQSNFDKLYDTVKNTSEWAKDKESLKTSVNILLDKRGLDKIYQRFKEDLNNSKVQDSRKAIDQQEGD